MKSLENSTRHCSGIRAFRVWTCNNSQVYWNRRAAGGGGISAKVINMCTILMSAVSVSLGGLRTTPDRSMIKHHPPAAMHSNNPTAPFHRWLLGSGGGRLLWMHTLIPTCLCDLGTPSKPSWFHPFREGFLRRGQEPNRGTSQAFFFPGFQNSWLDCCNFSETITAISLW